jgi:hypothetical protein
MKYTLKQIFILQLLVLPLLVLFHSVRGEPAWANRVLWLSHPAIWGAVILAQFQARKKIDGNVFWLGIAFLGAINWAAEYHESIVGIILALPDEFPIKGAAYAFHGLLMTVCLILTTLIVQGFLSQHKFSPLVTCAVAALTSIYLLQLSHNAFFRFAQLVTPVEYFEISKVTFFNMQYLGLSGVLLLITVGQMWQKERQAEARGHVVRGSAWSTAELKTA